MPPRRSTRTETPAKKRKAEDAVSTNTTQESPPKRARVAKKENPQIQDQADEEEATTTNGEDTKTTEESPKRATRATRKTKSPSPKREAKTSREVTSSPKRLDKAKAGPIEDAHDDKPIDHLIEASPAKTSMPNTTSIRKPESRSVSRSPTKPSPNKLSSQASPSKVQHRHEISSSSPVRIPPPPPADDPGPPPPTDHEPPPPPDHEPPPPPEAIRDSPSRARSPEIIKSSRKRQLSPPKPRQRSPNRAENKRPGLSHIQQVINPASRQQLAHNSDILPPQTFSFNNKAVVQSEETDDLDLDADDEADVGTTKKKTSQSRLCPYLDTLNRNVLDFDFEKLCSVSLKNHNVYACLVCGEFFEGRGRGSHAYYHSMKDEHHVFLAFESLKIYCLPDDYEIIDDSLEDIQYNVFPTFTPQQVAALDKKKSASYDLYNRKYLPGVVGLNNIKANDYMNVVIQALAHVGPLRDAMLLNTLPKSSELVRRFGMLMRKLWNPRAFKTHLSPHEFTQEVVNASNKKFKLTEQGDPLPFLSWLLNNISIGLKSVPDKQHRDIIKSLFQGELTVMEETAVPSSEGMAVDAVWGSKSMKFFILSLDLPVTPLFSNDQDFIPQISIEELLEKYNGSYTHFEGAQKKRYTIEKLPKFLILSIKRFTSRDFGKPEKNPTIVQFPIKNLNMAPYVKRNQPSKYNLIANIIHTGKLNEGSYKVQLLDKAHEQWHQLQDLVIEDTVPQMLLLSESCILIYERI